jgi:WD repeat-containing protein 70
MADEDVDMYAMMGIPMAFGKQVKKKVDVTARFDKTKRVDAPAATASTTPVLAQEEDTKATSSGTQKKDGGEQVEEKSDNDDSDEDDDDVDGQDGLADDNSFPITHEIKLKDHSKVRYI